jgi:glucosamine--fructose-6-phosphate aminotransferase (isomerizing)
MNPYISDILSQPDALRTAINKFSAHSLDIIYRDLNNGKFDHIIMTGMGSSYNACYPACLQLAGLSIPVTLISTAELLHFYRGQIGARTLLWLNSQSGRSAELVHLLERIKTTPPACILASVNDETSPMAYAADVCLPIHAGAETTVSTKTYVNMLAINLLVPLYLTGQTPDKVKTQLLSAAGEAESYLQDWQAHVAHIDTLLAEFEELFIVGRGPSMSTVWTGALICKEAAKHAVEGMNAGDFRHGPMELISPHLTALVLAGSPTTSALNHNLATDIVKHGGQALWIDSAPDTHLPAIIHPATFDLARPLMEILPLQLLTIALAERKGIQPGHFQVVGKVTSRE